MGDLAERISEEQKPKQKQMPTDASDRNEKHEKFSVFKEKAIVF